MRQSAYVSSLMLLVAASIYLGGCGTFTGLPGHGGGKRFAVEQELISASARAVSKDIDVTPLVGRKCALYIVNIGDEGSGNLIGGRYEWQAAIRGEYVASPTVKTSNLYPVIGTTTTSTTNTVPSTITETVAENALNAPSSSRQQTEGSNFNLGGGASYNGPGQYRSEAFINPLDAQFLRAVLHEAFMLRGVLVVPPSEAEVDVFVTVDVFGTIRSRVEMHLFNEEHLLAKTAIQISGVNRNRQVIMAPATSSWEAEYTEKYILWCGPMNVQKQVRRSEDLLVSFKDIPVDSNTQVSNGSAPVMPSMVEPREGTRPNPPVSPLPAPDPSRPEDVNSNK